MSHFSKIIVYHLRKRTADVDGRVVRLHPTLFFHYVRCYRYHQGCGRGGGRWGHKWARFLDIRHPPQESVGLAEVQFVWSRLKDFIKIINLFFFRLWNKSIDEQTWKNLSESWKVHQLSEVESEDLTRRLYFVADIIYFCRQLLFSDTVGNNFSTHINFYAE